jgi:lipid-A-disaccharide synthase
MRRLKALEPTLEIIGVGGPRMEAEGLQSLFPQSDIAVNGVGPVIRHLPQLLGRMRQTAADIVARRPDLLLSVDSPDFTLRVARMARAKLPGLKVVHWVCPSVWAWRPGRAPRMRPYVDEILCLLPFEPRELATLNGPHGTFVGHPLIEHLPDLRAISPSEVSSRVDAAHPVVLILPGSRRSEVSRLLSVFGEAAARISAARPGVRFVLPAVAHLASAIREQVGDWSVPVDVVVGEAAKYAAFRQARAAMAASGTVTLELALAQVPMIGCYKVSAWEAWLARRMIRVSSALLPNLVLGERLVPELLQDDCEPGALSAAMLGILDDDAPARRAMLDGFRRLERDMASAGDEPSLAAAQAVLRQMA